MEFNYDVFLSYRHRPLDGEITKKVFNALESYRLPAPIRERGFQDIRRVFRDTEELAVSKILTETIDDALRSTNCLVVVCSLDAPLSPWVDREVSMFIRMGRADYVYPLLINGDPERSFPPSLKLIPDVMDRLMDVRCPGDDPKKIMALAETALLKVIAGVTGCDEEELLREHQSRRSRRFTVRSVTAAAVFLAVAGISLGLMAQARNYRDTARRQENASMRILHELTYSLPDHLTNVPGAYARIADILQTNTEDINAILRLSTNRESAEYEAAANYEKLAHADTVLGMYDDALVSEAKAIELFSSLADSGSGKGIAALASAYNNRANLLNAMGRYAESARDYDRAISLQSGLEDRDDLVLGQMYVNAAANSVNSGDTDGAAERFEMGLALIGGLPESEDTIKEAANANYNYGVMLYRSGMLAEAEAKLTASCELYGELTAITDSLQNRNSSIQAVSILAACLTDQGKYEEADHYYDEALAAARELAADQDNLEYQLNLSRLYNNRGLNLNIQGQYRQANEYYLLASELDKRIYETTGAPSDAASYALALLNTGENAFKAGLYDTSVENFRAGLEVYAPVCESLGTYDTAQYYAWLSYYTLIHLRDYPGALDAALNAYDLQPDNVLVNLNLAYACLYCGYTEDADALLTAVASLGAGQKEAILLDLDAQQRAGLYTDHLETTLALLG